MRTALIEVGARLMILRNFTSALDVILLDINFQAEYLLDR